MFVLHCLAVVMLAIVELCDVFNVIVLHGGSAVHDVGGTPDIAATWWHR